MKFRKVGKLIEWKTHFSYLQWIRRAENKNQSNNEIVLENTEQTNNKKIYFE
jgi:hypothetical protein